MHKSGRVDGGKMVHEQAVGTEGGHVAAASSASVSDVGTGGVGACKDKSQVVLFEMDRESRHVEEAYGKGHGQTK